MKHHHPFVPGPGVRTPQTLLWLDERNRFLVEAAAFFRDPSDREVARQLRSALAIYRACAWRRDASLNLCPPKYAGTVKAAFWKCCKAVDATPPGVETIRKVLARAS